MIRIIILWIQAVLFATLWAFTHEYLGVNLLGWGLGLMVILGFQCILQFID